MAQITPSSDLDFVDDFYYSALFDEDEHEIFPPSDDKYAEELQFQEALMSSTVFSKMGNNDICNPCIAHASSPLLIQAVPLPELLEMETEETGESSLSFCEICVERKENDQMFTTQSCNHSYCSDCIRKHVSTRVEENLTVVRCPGVNCETVLELDECRPLLPEVVIHRWEDALCQEFISASQRFYCPFRDCSASLLNDGGEVIREAECPFCHRLFCAQCYVPWHPGIACEDLQRLNEDERGREDLMVRELAKENKWARCPKCKYYVERTVGVSSSFVMVAEKSGVTLMVAAKGIKNTTTQQYRRISLPLREGNQFFSTQYEVSVYYRSRTSIQYHGYAFVIDLHRHRVSRAT
ncbi:hypothetical protein Gotri_010041 [Gossypium trilobum]|uniref:RBR-type E3 ubiquitin transferase n=1 Tax=Gossypium trilobum TaxID=34281 RepID=A0A7J9EPC4_9ROSI|nr:hypothetical protein [Gossypium trilobum]